VKKKLLFVGVVFLLLVALVVSCGPAAPTTPTTPTTPTGPTTPTTPTGPTEVKPIELQWAFSFPSVGLVSDCHRELISMLEEALDGRYEFEDYWGGSLLSSMEMLPGLKKGIADIGTSVYS